MAPYSAPSVGAWIVPGRREGANRISPKGRPSSLGPSPTIPHPQADRRPNVHKSLAVVSQAAAVQLRPRLRALTRPHNQHRRPSPTPSCVVASLPSKPTVGEQWTRAVAATASSMRLRSRCMGTHSGTVSRAKRPFDTCVSTAESSREAFPGTLTPMSTACPERARSSRVKSKS